MTNLRLIQLPNDVVSVGYKQTNPFKFEQVYFSKSKNFTGTEHEFLQKGFAYAYAYAQTSKYTRITI